MTWRVPTDLYIVINVVLERQLPKVDIDVISRFFEADGRVKASFDVFEVDVPESDGWRILSVWVVLLAPGKGNKWVVDMEGGKQKRLWEEKEM